jgi:hypothetical protein
MLEQLQASDEIEAKERQVLEQEKEWLISREIPSYCKQLKQLMEVLTVLAVSLN